MLDRLEISWKRSREHVHSPDPDYEAKLDAIVGLRDEVRASNGRLVLVYLDEVTIYHQPTLANAWEEKGHHQALAERSHQSNTPTRVVATLDLVTGQVVYRRRSKLDISELVGFYRDDLRPTYSKAVRSEDCRPHPPGARNPAATTRSNRAGREVLIRPSAAPIKARRSYTLGEEVDVSGRKQALPNGRRRQR